MLRTLLHFVSFLQPSKWKEDEEMVSFDVVRAYLLFLFFSDFPTVEELLNNSNLHTRTSPGVNDIVELLKLCLEITNFVFRDNYYHQKFECAMGNLVSTLIA